MNRSAASSLPPPDDGVDQRRGRPGRLCGRDHRGGGQAARQGSLRPGENHRRPGEQNPQGRWAIEQLRTAGQANQAGRKSSIMANALATAGLAVRTSGIWAIRRPHPVFEDLARRARVISFAEPGHTDALEFNDGKLILGKHQTLGEVDWPNLLRLVGRGDDRRAWHRRPN